MSYYGSTAYLDDEPLPDGSHIGVNKHTDQPVHLRWDPEAEEWVHVCQRTFRLVNIWADEWIENLPRPDCSCP